MSAYPDYDDSAWEVPVKETGDGLPFATCPAGSHSGVIVGLFDVGTHNEFNKLEQKWVESRQLVTVVELRRRIPEGFSNGGKPFLLARSWTYSFHERANLTKIYQRVMHEPVVSGTGKKYSPLVLLGRPVAAEVANKTVKEKTYHVLVDIHAISDEVIAPEATVPLARFSVVEWAKDPSRPLPGFAGMPKVFGRNIEDIVKASKEYALATGGKPEKAPAGRPGPGPGPATAGYIPVEGDEGDDDIPF